MSNVARLEHLSRVLPCLPPVLEAIDSLVQPIHHVSPNECIRYGDFEPHSVSNLQARVGSCHCSHYGVHRSIDCKLHFFIRPLGLWDAGGDGGAGGGEGADRGWAARELAWQPPARLCVSHPGPGVDGSHRLCSWYGEVAFGVWIPTLGNHKFYRPRLLNNFPKHPNSLVITHVLKVNIVDLEYHVPWLNATVQSHSTSLHY